MKKTSWITASVLAGTLLIGGVTFAAMPGAGNEGGFTHGPMMENSIVAAPFGIFGTVTAVNGNTLTVQAPSFPRMHPMNTSTMPTSTTYTVDATNAAVLKNGTSSTVGAIAVNDTVMVRGPISGTNVAAKQIVDGVMPGERGMDDWWNATGTRPSGTHENGQGAGALANLQGNGEPVVGGTVTAVNGAMFTVTNAGNVTYSIDATSAAVVKGNATSSVSAVAVNDRIVVQGTVNGTAVTASSVIDMGPVKSATSSTSTAPKGPMGGLGGFFGGIGSFFKHLFGFF